MTYTRKQGGASGWKKCEHCGMLFCKKHGKEYCQHVIECAKDDNSDDGVAAYAI